VAPGGGGNFATGSDLDTGGTGSEDFLLAFGGTAEGSEWDGGGRFLPAAGEAVAVRAVVPPAVSASHREG
jgi:hypothetical protein